MAFLFGHTSSKALVDATMESIMRVSLSDVQNSSQVVPMSQVVKLTGNRNIIDNVKLDQAVKLNMNSLKKTLQSSNLTNRIMADMMSQAKAKNKGFLNMFSNTSSKSSQTLRSIISSVVNVQNVQDCAQASFLSQSLHVDGDYNIIANFTMHQSLAAVQKCLSRSVQRAGLKSKIDQHTSNKGESVSTGPFAALVDAVSGFFSGNMGWFVFVAIAVIVVYMWFNSDPMPYGAGYSMGYPPSYPPAFSGYGAGYGYM